jgi:phosphotransferase system enzyme I (PtsP)
VPALLWGLDELLPEVAFLCIGTNDLSALLYAQDRDTESTLDARVGLQPTFWRCLDGIAREARASQVPVIVCGMLAGLWPEALLLRGLGFQLSLTTDRLSPIARNLAAIPATQATLIVAEVQRCATADEAVGVLHAQGLRVESEV